MQLQFALLALFATVVITAIVVVTIVIVVAMAAIIVVAVKNAAGGSFGKTKIVALDVTMVAIAATRP